MKQALLIGESPDVEQALRRSRPGVRIERQADWALAQERLLDDSFSVVIVSQAEFVPGELINLIRLDELLAERELAGLVLVSSPSGVDPLRSVTDKLKAFTTTVLFNQDELDAPDSELRRKLDEILPPETPAEPREVTVELPPISQGRLDAAADLPRLLYTLAQVKATGVLSMKTGGIERTFPLVNGALGVGVQGDYATPKMLLRAFAWRGGEYTFEAQPIEAQRTGSLHSVIQRGIEKHLSDRDILQGFVSVMKRYPAPTQRWLGFKDKFQGSTVERVLEASTGEVSLESALGTFGAKTTRAAKAAFYAFVTDLFYLAQSPERGHVVVSYVEPKVSKPASPQRADRGQPLAQPEPDRESPSQAPDGPSTTQQSPPPQAAPPATDDPVAQLQRLHSMLDSITPHQLFGLWEGCGRDAVQARFYQLVKQHHPDVHGGNVSSEIKRLAQQVFIAIKQAYQDLSKIEAEQTRPSPPGWPDQWQMPSGTEPSTPSEPAAASFKPASSNARRSKLSRLRSRGPNGEAKPGKADESTSDARREKLAMLRAKSASAPKARRSIGHADPAKNLFNRGYQAYKSEAWSRAVEFFRGAHEAQPENGLYMTFYAWTLFLSDAKQVEHAQQLLRRAIATGHKQALPDAHYFLGHILKVCDKPDAALSHFQKVLRLNPGSREAEREIRLHRMRKKEDKESVLEKDLLETLFKKRQK